MKTKLAALAFTAALATVSGAAQASSSISVEGDNNVTIIEENHYHIKNLYNEGQAYGGPGYDPSYFMPPQPYIYYHQPYVQPYMPVRPMAPPATFYGYVGRPWYR